MQLHNNQSELQINSQIHLVSIVSTQMNLEQLTQPLEVAQISQEVNMKVNTKLPEFTHRRSMAIRVKQKNCRICQLDTMKARTKEEMLDSHPIQMKQKW
jgi:hypothetical protein